jgi:hypothetical protein
MGVCCCVDSKLLAQWLAVDRAWHAVPCAQDVRMLHQQHELHCLGRMDAGSWSCCLTMTERRDCAQLFLQLIGRQVAPQECGVQNCGGGCRVQPGYVIDFCILLHQDWHSAGSSLQFRSVTTAA